jgi:drug/metabolite transporter (DMT)-like permease
MTRSPPFSGPTLALLAALAMAAFAGNSLLTRAAVGPGLIDAPAFALWRLVSGAAVLALLVALRRLRGPAPLWPGWGGRPAGVAGLVAYLAGFTAAYQALDAGTGALVLFGCVQVTMFAGALARREAVPPRRWIGAVLALCGLALMARPGAALPEIAALALMAGAGIGWGIYSLSGLRGGDALSATAANFVLSVPVLAALALLLPAAPGAPPAAPAGVALALVSGALTSGLGYALWFAILPRLGATRAALAQLTVPVLAALGGAALLAEWPTARLLAATALVIGGVALGLYSRGARGRTSR